MSIAFKRFLKVTLVMLLIVFDILAIMALKDVLTDGVHTIDTEEFESVIEWGEDISFNGITIIDNRFLGLVEIPLTEDMIVSVDDTDEAGKKKIVFEHDEKQYVVYFDVKYKVEFTSYGEVIDTQMVVGTDELVLPVPEAKTGYEFSHWDYDLSLGLTESKVVNAVFKEIEYPELTPLSATYGDTLADFDLPSNKYGKWEFMSSAETSVGDAGRHSVPVRFAYVNDDTVYKYAFIDINVEKKELSFESLKDSFAYDGEPHFPTYTLGADVSVISTGSASTAAGVYGYTLEVVDDNYSGYHEGTFEIWKPTVTVTVSSAEIVYPAAVPEFTYTAEGFDNVDLLGIKVDAPEFAQSGTYEIGITYTNENVNYIVHKGSLSVLKGTIDVDIPSISQATYEDRLADIEFIGNFLGTWAWEDPDLVIESMEKVVAYAVFTPSDENYEPVRKEISITYIQRKTLTIEIVKSTFIYVEGMEHSVEYKLTGGRYSDEFYKTLNVTGNISEENAGSYMVNLQLDDTCYTASAQVELKINKAEFDADFSKVYEIYWAEGLKLSDIKLDGGYSWSDPDKLISGAVTESYEAIYTPFDSDNYVNAAGKIKVIVHKSDVKVDGVLDKYEKDYDTKEYDIKNSGINAIDTDGNVDIVYLDKDGNEIDKIVNAGEYTLRITVGEGTNYTGTVIERDVTVKPIENSQTVQTSQSAKYGDDLGALTLPKDLEGTWTWDVSELGGAGTKTLYAIYVPDGNGNYNPRRVPVTVKVDKISLDIPAPGDKTYTGEEIDTGFRDTDEYTVEGDIAATDEGTYYITFTLRDPDNYEWLGEPTKASVVKSYKISKLPIVWTIEPNQNITSDFTGDEIPIPMEPLTEGVTVSTTYYDADGNELDYVPTDAGTYKVVITATKDKYADYSGEIILTINRVGIDVPADVDTDLTYNGTSQDITVTDERLGTLFTAEYTPASYAGDVATAVLTLDPNYKWNATDKDGYVIDNDAGTLTISAAIAKIKVTVTGTTAVNSAWTYTQTLSVTKAAIDDASVAAGIEAVLRYSTDGTNFYELSALLNGDGYLNAGTYYVKTVVEATKNYDLAQSAAVSFVVNPVELKGTVSWSDSYKNGGSYYKNLIENNDNKPESLVIYYTDLTTNENVTVEVSSSYTWAISSAGFNGEATVYTFKVTASGYNANIKMAEDSTADVAITVPLKTVATIGYGGTAYGSIEDALAAAGDSASSSSPQVVWVVPDKTGKLKIVSDVEIKAYVTLRLPYGSDADSYNDDYTAELYYDRDGLDAPAEKNSAYLVTRVILSAGKTITVWQNGILDIAGELSGGGFKNNAGEPLGVQYAGHTARYYALLELGAKSTIKCHGTINALGYIRETADNNGSTVHLMSTGVMYQPFVFRDFRSGNYVAPATEFSSFKPQWTHKFSPFARFIFMNVSPTVRFECGGKLMGVGNLYANQEVNFSIANVVGSSSSDFIQLSSGAHLISKYNVATEVMDLDFYGGATLNSFDLSLAGSTIGSIIGSVSSSSYTFPLTYHNDISLNNLEDQTGAVYSMLDDYKMLPGAKLVVGQGVTLNIGSLNIYDSTFKEELTLVNKNDGSKINDVLLYPYVGDAIFIVRGTVIAESLGGKVQADENSDGAKITVTTATTVTSYEITQFYLSDAASAVNGISPYGYKGVTNSLKLYYGDTLCRNSVIRNIEYTFSVADSDWKFDMPDYIEVTFADGFGIYTDSALIEDENGDLYLGTFDSTETKVNGTVRVLVGSTVTFYLTKNQLLATNAASTVTLTSLTDLHSGADTYLDYWEVKEGESPVVYYVHALKLEVSGADSYSIAYKNLSLTDTASSITSTITVSASKKSDAAALINGKKSATVTMYSNVTETTLDTQTKSTSLGTATATVTVTVTKDEDIKVTASKA